VRHDTDGRREPDKAKTFGRRRNIVKFDI
jgi:hypothetical protein